MWNGNSNQTNHTPRRSLICSGGKCKPMRVSFSKISEIRSMFTIHVNQMWYKRRCYLLKHFDKQVPFLNLITSTSYTLLFPFWFNTRHEQTCQTSGLNINSVTMVSSSSAVMWRQAGFKCRLLLEWGIKKKHLQGFDWALASSVPFHSSILNHSCIPSS